jgi:hypothetical protein
VAAREGSIVEDGGAVLGVAGSALFGVVVCLLEVAFDGVVYQGSSR